MPPTCFGHPCGDPLGDGSQKMDILRYTNVGEPMHRLKYYVVIVYGLKYILK